VNSVGRLVILVKEYEEALEFYCGALGFEKFVDVQAGARRFVHVRLPGQPEFGIWLLRAETAEDLQRVGNQTGKQPVAVAYTDDLNSDAERLRARGVTFSVQPKEEPGAAVAHFLDLYGNEYVLVQMK
jgi:catechol 2,3-dioxygenase-like lactoylglutathione lyase family enzyme